MKTVAAHIRTLEAFVDLADTLDLADGNVRIVGVNEHRDSVVAQWPTGEKAGLYLGSCGRRWHFSIGSCESSGYSHAAGIHN